MAELLDRVKSVGLEQQSFVKGFIRMCDESYKQGWHERNGGNASYRMTTEEMQQSRSFFKANARDWVALPVRALNLAGEYFLVTGAGKFMQNVARSPRECLGIVEIDSTGSAYRVVWGLEDGSNPTSEFVGHFINHAVRKKRNANGGRVLYHCHPAGLITMGTFVEPDSKAYTLALWKMMTECICIFPDGLGVVDCLVPGSIELAEATARLMSKHDAIVWTHHGLFVCGDTFDAAFGLSHVVAKAADMYVSACLVNGGTDLKYTISNEQLKKCAEAASLSIPTGYLD